MALRGEDWGKGMFETSLEYDDVRAFDEQLGLRELRAKLNGKAGITYKYAPNQFSVSAEFNYGSKSIEIMRKYLDSGILLQLLESDLWKNNRCWTGPDGHKYITLVACAMSLGCKLPPKMKDGLSKLVHPQYIKLVRDTWPSYARSATANQQFKKAIETYKEGEPYQWGNVTFLEGFSRKMLPGKKTTLKNLGNRKVIETVLHNGAMIPQLIGPATDDELGVKPIYPASVCANCGEKDAEDNKLLLVCSRCHDRKYCGKECQKKHWKMHKVICTVPKTQMEAFINSIPLDAIKRDQEGGDSRKQMADID